MKRHPSTSPQAFYPRRSTPPAQGSLPSSIFFSDDVELRLRVESSRMDEGATFDGARKWRREWIIRHRVGSIGWDHLFRGVWHVAVGRFNGRDIRGPRAAWEKARCGKQGSEEYTGGFHLLSFWKTGRGLRGVGGQRTRGRLLPPVTLRLDGFDQAIGDDFVFGDGRMPMTTGIFETIVESHVKDLTSVAVFFDLLL